MIHRGNHRTDGSAVGECQHADLGTGEELLDDDLVAGIAKRLVLHDAFDRILCLGQILRDKHALSQSQTVGLDDDGKIGSFQIFHCLGGVVKNLIGGSGDTVLFHQVFGKDLAGFDAGSLGVRTETGDACLVQTVYAAESQRVIRSHHREINCVGLGKVNNSGDIFGADLRDTNRIQRNAAIAGKAVNCLHGSILFQFLNNGVLTATTADNQ